MTTPDPLAVFSPDRRYRYVLRRTFGLFGGPTCLFICLNPSTADELTDDPTVRRCIGFAKAWGFGHLTVCNLFAYRATDPTDMMSQEDPVGPENDSWLMREAVACERMVVAWGNHGVYRDRASQVLSGFAGLRRTWHHLGVTKAGEPKHPLYLSADTKPQVWV